MINNVVLVGRLTKDADLRYTSNGTAVASFTLAVNKAYKKENEEQKADFINCVIWRKIAESLANYTRKGSLIGVEGRIQTRSYDNQQGQKVFVTEVNVETVTFLESKKTGTQSNSDNKQTNTPNYNSNQTSSNYSRPETKPYSTDGVAQHDISDDDLPF